MTVQRRRLIVAAVVLLVAFGSGCAVGRPTSSQAADSPHGALRSAATATGTSDAPGAAPSPAAVAQRVGSVLPEDPVSIILPSRRDVPVHSVSTTANGVLDVPENIGIAGWWRGGSRIGDPFGATLIAAHVDSSTQGLGPFAELLSVKPGAEITVRTDTLTQTFRVETLRLRPKGSIAPTSSLHSPDGQRRLTLVTCAGPFDRARGGYQNLAIVIASPIGDAVETRAR